MSVVNVFKWVKMSEVLGSKMTEIILCLWLWVSKLRVLVCVSVSESWSLVVLICRVEWMSHTCVSIADPSSRSRGGLSAVRSVTGNAGETWVLIHAMGKAFWCTHPSLWWVSFPVTSCFLADQGAKNAPVSVSVYQTICTYRSCCLGLPTQTQNEGHLSCCCLDICSNLTRINAPQIH